MTEKEIAVLALLYGKLQEVDLETVGLDQVGLNEVDVIDVFTELTTTRNNLYQRYFDTEDKQLEELYLEIVQTIDKLLESIRDPDIDLNIDLNEDPEETE